MGEVFVYAIATVAVYEIAKWAIGLVLAPFTSGYSVVGAAATP